VGDDDEETVGRVGLSLRFPDMQGDGGGREGQFEVFGRTPVEDEKDEDDTRDEEGDDENETVVGRFWKEDELGSFGGNLAWVTLESGVHFKSCASFLLAKVSWDSCEDLDHTRLVTPILYSD
jgi:hypothetical protein